ncbi:MAG: VTT domain-containing protein [Angelakisella sp.]
MKKNKKNYWGFLLLGLLFVAVTIGAVPVIRVMMRPEFQQQLTLWVEGAGIWGVGALFLLQVSQIIVAVIPGEPVEVVAGAMYGTFGGLAVCMAGILFGSAMIFAVVRKLGRERISKTKLYPKLMEYDFLKNEEKLQAMVFLLYLIPGTPKDILVYVCALTTLSMKSFLTVSTLARIPSVITSTMAGASFANGNYMATLLIFILTGIAGLVGIHYHNKRFGKKQNN